MSGWSLSSLQLPVFLTLLRNFPRPLLLHKNWPAISKVISGGEEGHKTRMYYHRDIISLDTMLTKDNKYLYTAAVNDEH